jgi:hypothetical protein
LIILSVGKGAASGTLMCRGQDDAKNTTMYWKALPLPSPTTNNYPAQYVNSTKVVNLNKNIYSEIIKVYSESIVHYFILQTQYLAITFPNFHSS